MLATYASVLAVCASSLAIGAATLSLCGRREWSWLAPGVGLGLVTTLCWATVRLPGDGLIAAIAVAGLTLASLAHLRGRCDGVAATLRDGIPVGIAALAAASLPFIVEGRFGILGTSFNPDMSQHLLAADRLAHGADSQLLSQGYPLGPHAIVVALDKGLGVGLVQGFGGLTLAVSVLAALTALGGLGALRPLPRWIGALLVGLPYMVASYLAQGACKETMQALFVLAFAIGMLDLAHTAARGRRGGMPGSQPPHSPTGHTPSPAPLGPLTAVPLAILAAGSVYTYSFPGLSWLIGALGIWAIVELLTVARGGGDAAAALRGAARAAWPALVVFAVLVAPELGRMIDFSGFETFDPNGAGLGNLFGQVSPTEALGIWPSGDFRLTPGDGAVPALAFYAGVAFAALLLAWALAWWLRNGKTAVLAALAAAGLAYLAARVGGTPYTAAKAIEMAAPLAMLTIVRPLFDLAPFDRVPAITRQGARPGRRLLKPLAAASFVVAAGGCSLLALANGPVGPSGYSPALAGFRPEIAHGSTQVLAPPRLISDQHGRSYLAWELRGGRVCIGATGPAITSQTSPPPRGIDFVISWKGVSPVPPFAKLRLVRRAGPYYLWKRTGTVKGPSPCPLIAVRSARQGEKGTTD